MITKADALEIRAILVDGGWQNLPSVKLAIEQLDKLAARQPVEPTRPSLRLSITVEQERTLASLPVGQFDLAHATQPAGPLTTLWINEIEEHRVIVQSVEPNGDYRWQEAGVYTDLEWGDPQGISEPLWAPREVDA